VVSPHKKTIMGLPSPVAPERPKPPSVPTRMEAPRAPAPKPAPPAPPPSASAKAPPPPRQPEPPEEEDFDEAPTAMFVHPVKYTYDPDAPPGAPGAPASLEDDDDDDYEPPTAIHMSPYRGDAGGPEPFGQIQRPPAVAPPSATPAPVVPKAPVPAAGAPAKPPPFMPPGVVQSERQPQPQPQSQPARPQVDPRMLETQQVSSAQPPAQFIPGQTGSGLMTPTGTPMATFVDPDAAPVWLKALALSSVVSALTVLGVLGWMLSGRF